MANFNPGDRVIICDGSDQQGRISVVSDDSVKALKPSKGIVYVKLGRFHVPFADHDLRPAWQTCKDCDGSGRVMERGLYTTWDDCPTCDGDGRINCTGPYRLADGTWSDGVDRRLPLSERAMNLGRWEVTRSDWEDAGWFAQFKEHADMIGCHEREFPTHAEAIAYADRMARTNQGENNE